MKVFRNIEEVKIKRPIATIGIFDGVHLAHQAIIEELKLMAFELNGEATIVTLWPHPRIVLQKDSDELRLLNTLDEKIARLEESGIKNLVILPFDTQFAATNFDSFIRNVMVEKINIAHLVVGFNHQFGKNREGNFDKLQQLSDELHFGLSQQNPVLINKEKVSSSAIRRLFQSGDVQKANNFLGYTYSITGNVVHGNQKGREIGFPTANIVVNDSYKMIPANGVYATKVFSHELVYDGMMNIGYRPTLTEDSTMPVIEVHLLNFEGDLYGKELRIEFIDRVRDEKKFNSINELQQQITSDREIIKKTCNKYKLPIVK